LALVALASEPDEQFIARMKREKGEKLVEACLEQITFDPDLELDLDKDKLIDCVNREVERCRPKLKNEMKHGSRKNV
jgi:hypothetical protein